MTAKDILRTEYLSADKEETLLRVNSRIKDEAFSDVLVFDKEKTIGIFSPSRSSMILPKKESMGNMRIKKLVKSINTLSEEAGINEIMIKMMRTGNNILPISKKGRVVGIVHLFDLLDALKFDSLKVSDIEMQEPFILLEDEKIGNAIEILHENIHNLILIKDKNNNPVGILNGYDLLRNLKLDLYKEDRQKNGYKSEWQDMLALPISEFIKGKKCVKVNSKDAILDIIGHFKANNVTGLIVKDSSLIIRPQDILNNLEKSQIVKTRAVCFVGLRELNMDDQITSSIKDTAQRSFEKIKEIIQQDAILKVHIKGRFA
ncbi:MAG: CBS domain-containing protein, partial [archaeon]